MNLHFSKWNFFLLFLLYACSEEKRPTTAKNVAPTLGTPSTVEKTIIDSVEASNSTMESRPHGVDGLARKEIMEDVRSSIERLGHDDDTILTTKHALEAFTHPSLLNIKGSPKEIEEAFQSARKSLADELRDPSGMWNTDAILKRAIVGRLVLMLTFFGSDSTEIARFPELMSDVEQRVAPTEGDFLMLRIVAQAMALAESRPELPDAALAAWTRIAKSPNPACRAAALVAFEAMQTTPAQQGEFYFAYAGESCLPVAKLYIERLEVADIAPAVSLIIQFKSQSPAAPQLEGLIDETLAKLHERPQ